MPNTPMPPTAVAAPDDSVAQTEAELAILWGRLLRVAASASGDQAERVRRSVLHFDPSLAFAASTKLSAIAGTTSVRAGILGAMLEIGRVVASTSSNPDHADASVPTKVAVDDAGARIAFVLQWLTSDGGHAVPLVPPRLGPGGETFATGLAVGAIAFVLAHELGHVVMSGNAGAAGSYEREREADRWAARLLRSVPVPALTADEVPSLANVPIDPDLTIPSAVMFLWFEGLHRRADASLAAFESGAAVPADLTVFDVTETESHPSPYRRIEWLRDDAATADLDGSEVAGIDAIRSGFDALLSVIADQMPEHRLTAEERDHVLQGDPPTPVPSGTTWHDVYRAEVTGLLIAATRRGELTADDIAQLLEMIERLPRTVLGALGDAVAGTLLPPEEHEAAGLTSLAANLQDRFTNPLVQRAITRPRKSR